MTYADVKYVNSFSCCVKFISNEVKFVLLQFPDSLISKHVFSKRHFEKISSCFSSLSFYYSIYSASGFFHCYWGENKYFPASKLQTHDEHTNP